MTRPGLVFIVLLISSFANYASLAYSTETADNSEGRQAHAIDVNQFDPFEFFKQMIEEGEASDKTRTRNCYDLGNVSFSFASVVDENNGDEVSPEYDEVSDRSGQTYLISKSPILDKIYIQAENQATI